MRQTILIFTAVLAACTGLAEIPADIPQLSDNDISTSYTFSRKRAEAVFTDFTAPVLSYKVFSGGETPDRDPRGWVLSGSVDGRKWTEVDRRDGVTFCSRFQEAMYTIGHPAAFKTYKLTLLPGPKQDSIALGEVQFFERDLEKDWQKFVYPEVVFTVDNPGSEGVKAYGQLVQDPDAYAKFHARKVAEILFFSDRDSIHYIGTINYLLRDFDGVAYKAGDGDEVSIHFSTRHIAKSAAQSLAKLDFETRGVLYHELVHGYQYSPKGCGDYGSSKVYWSFIEGVADAVRAQSGHFDMATRRPGGTWLDGYRTTGFFLQWLTRDDPDAIRKFHRTALELPVWSWDAAIKVLYGPDSSIESKWEEYQNWLKSDENKNQIIY